METTIEVREYPPKELAKSNWPTKAGYEWVAMDVRTQYSIFWWLQLLKMWLNCTPIFEKGARRDIVASKRVSAVECVCHGREGVDEEFFYMYMCHFSQLHIRLSFDEFTMGVLRLLNIAPTQLHPNSWAYLQAFWVLCRALYLQPSPRSFLYFFDTRPRSPTTWLSLISRSRINRLDTFTQSFKHFKDGFFKVVVKQGGRSHFYTNDGSTKFPFYWTGNPWRYKGMAREELSVVDKEVVDAVMQFSDKMPTKGLVRVYNSVHPIIDIEGHMAPMGKKNLTFFQTLRKEKPAKAKRKVELLTRSDKGKDVKKVRAALLGSGLSASGKGPKVGLIELLETVVPRDIEINMSETFINAIDSMEPNALSVSSQDYQTRQPTTEEGNLSGPIRTGHNQHTHTGNTLPPEPQLKGSSRSSAIPSHNSRDAILSHNSRNTTCLTPIPSHNSRDAILSHNSRNTTCLTPIPSHNSRDTSINRLAGDTCRQALPAPRPPGGCRVPPGAQRLKLYRLISYRLAVQPPTARRHHFIPYHCSHYRLAGYLSPPGASYYSDPLYRCYRFAG
ncbi:hypothetical protein DEO72_LG8g1655 [Vigna unguiculata]|uniref:Transposase (putative) gypsy type domain-containing protein n=1 Tax=Vigna unguiculata TaxID=3917 RepID=A0A4D6MQ04_VIGUN|nr:hypothetical protein DEO72_LG8g1655 [Vigna unguiculata]